MNSTRRTKKTASQSTTSLIWGVTLLIALFLCRLLVPTEAAEQGMTLWLCSSTFAFGLAFFFLKFRIQDSISYRPALSDLAVSLMVTGHLVSGSYILLTGLGNQRSALNVMWEWLAIGLFWILMRLLLIKKESRRIFANTFIIAVLGLSLLGIWQHYVWYPQQAESFEKLLEYNDRSTANELLSSEERKEFRALVDSFGTEILTLDKAGRMSYLARVHASVEPIGLFVLANTFALFLLVAFLIVLFNFYANANQLELTKKVTICTIGFSLLLCLILTKSRTAWVGAVAAIFLYFLFHWVQTRTKVRLQSRYLFVAIGLIIGIIIWATLTGGLDRQVISEAPKSLQYRLEYWTSTIELLQDRPLLGAGPGNFRQHYLRYKLPGSSEEILDPHNLFLGIWSGGGVIALLGLLMLILSGLINGIQNFQERIEQSKKVIQPNTETRQVMLPIICAYFFTISTLFLLEGYLDQRLVLLGAISFVLMLLVMTAGVQFSLTTTCSIAAFVAASIHLLGASGIEMPAVVMLLLLLVHFTDKAEGADKKPFLLKGKTHMTGMLFCGGMLIGSLLSGLIPVQLSRTDLNIGNSMLLLQGNPQSAKRYFNSASEADSLSPEPFQQLAMFHFSTWQNSGERDEDEFELAIKNMNEAIQRDPFAAGRYRTLGNFWSKKAEKSGRESDAVQAVNAYQKAASLYPNFAAIRAELALSQLLANQSPVEAARLAMELDHLNHELGHTDKFLDEEIRMKLLKIAE